MGLELNPPHSRSPRANRSIGITLRPYTTSDSSADADTDTNCGTDDKQCDQHLDPYLRLPVQASHPSTAHQVLAFLLPHRLLLLFQCLLSWPDSTLHVASTLIPE